VSRARRGWLAVFATAIAFGAGALGALAAPGDIPASYFIVEDELGANDVVAQSDLSQLGRDDTNADYYKLFWSWDEIDQWTGTGQTGDACALFDSDGDGKINVAVCAQISNFNADPADVRQTTGGSPYVFKCGDTKNDRCAQPKGPQARTVTQVTAGQIGSASGGVLNATANLITDTDPFDEGDLNGPGDDFDQDSTIEIFILKSYLRSTAGVSSTTAVDLVNVCSYPSAGNGGNNNPFDCIITPGAGFLKIVKQTPLNTSATFDFTVSPTPVNGDATYSLTPATDTTVNPNKAQADTGPISMLIGTNISVTEAAPPAGWSFTSVSCTVEGVTGNVGTAGTRTITGVPINSGKVTTCTFTNDPVAPKLTVTKTVTNDDGGNAVVSDFPLFVDGNSVVSGVKNTFSAGQHTVSETGLSSYTASAWGGDCAADGTITLAFGDDKTCTITNDDDAPTLKLVKSVDNGNGGNAGADDWTLYATAAAPNDGRNFNNLGGSGAFTTVFSNAGYVLSESTGPAGYTAGSWSCDGGTLVGSTVTLDEDADVTCTITNDDVGPTLTLVKTVTNDDGGNAVVSDFPLFINGNAVTSGASNSLSANTLYTASETTLTGYTPSAWGGDCAADGTITLAEGQNATCTITNDDVAPTLKLVKNVDNGNGGNAAADDWTLFAAAAEPKDARNFSNLGGSGDFESVFSNTGYDLSESAGPAGYTAGSWSCDGGSLVGSTVTLTEGETDVTCSITNDDVGPTLTLVKIVVNDDGGNAVVSDFPLFISGVGVTSGASNPLSANTLYTASETSLDGYTPSAWGGDCAADGTITLSEGQNATCTITNDDVAPTLKLVKSVTNDNGGEAVADDWTLSADADAPFDGRNFSNLGGSGDFESVFSNTGYDLSESTVLGYTPKGWSCVGGDLVGSTVTLTEGESGVVCTITNDDDKHQPTGTTVQHWVLHDTITLDLRAGGGAASVTFELYDNDACTDGNGDDPGGLVGSETIDPIAGNVVATSTGVTVYESGAYYWRAHYSGNDHNLALDTACGDEITQILAKDAYDGGRDDFADPNVTLVNFAEFG
jgi:hypothetical protein